MNKKVFIFIQARMGSTRLPNKMMLWLGGYPVAEWVLKRSKLARHALEVVFLIPDGQRDDVLANYITSIGGQVFRGPENDVVSRFYLAACTFNAEVVVRVCGDNPLICGSEVDRLIELYLDSACDYAYNNVSRGANKYPTGIGAEISSFGLLEMINREALSADHREHVYNYIWANQNHFRIATVNPANETLAHPDLKFDLDTLDDYRRLLRLGLKIDSGADEIITAGLRDQRKWQ